MATDKPINEFDIEEVSEGCNYADDIRALTKKQSPDSMNVEFFNGRIYKRSGEAAFTTLPTGQGGIDTYTKLMLHSDGTSTSQVFTDSELVPKTVTANGGVQISTAAPKFGTGCALFNGAGNDTYTKLLLHMNGTNGSSVFTDSSNNGYTVTPNGNAQISTSSPKLGNGAGMFDGTDDYLSVESSSDWVLGAGDFTIDFWVKFSTLPSVLGTTEFLVNLGDNLTDALSILMDSTNALYFTAQDALGVTTLAQYRTGVNVINDTTMWHHVAVVRSSSNFYIFVDGVSQALTTLAPIGSNSLVGTVNPLIVAARFNGGTPNFFLYGRLDEFRFSAGIARWTVNFTTPTTEYSAGDYLTLADSTDWTFNTGDFTIDFWLNLVTVSDYRICGQYDSTNDWRVFTTALGVIGINTSGYPTGGAATLSSIAGVVTTGWHHYAIIRRADSWYIFKDGISQTLAVTPAAGVSYTDLVSLLYIGWNGVTTEFLTGFIDEFRISKGIARWPDTFSPPSLAYDTFSAAIDQIGFSIIDFSDTSQNHKQIAHLGTNVVAYDRLTNVKRVLRTGAPYVRSFNAKVSSFLIQSYNDYSAPYYWDGASATMAPISTNAPGFKRVIEYQGYLIGMNTATAKTRCYYQSTSNLLGGGAAYADFFTLTPAPNDDEISDPFLLNGRLYVGTKYSIFRVSFVGGVTVFEFKQVISDTGVVPGTVCTVITKDYGQVVLFLGTDKRIYLFDGANVKAISDLFYVHNNETPISLDLIDDNYKENAFAVYDFINRVYRLWVTKKSSSKNYYCMNVNVDTFAYYPFDNMQFCCGAVGYDNLLRPFLVCSDYSGILHLMFIDTNTDNGTPINEYYKSPLVSANQTVVKQGQLISLNMAPSSNANMVIYDKINYAKDWQFRQAVPMCNVKDKVLGSNFVLGSSKLGSVVDLIQAFVSINIVFNTYRFQMYSDNPTAVGWEVIDIDVTQANLTMGTAEPRR